MTLFIWTKWHTLFIYTNTSKPNVQNDTFYSVFFILFFIFFTIHIQNLVVALFMPHLPYFDHLFQIPLTILLDPLSLVPSHQR